MNNIVSKLKNIWQYIANNPSADPALKERFTALATKAKGMLAPGMKALKRQSETVISPRQKVIDSIRNSVVWIRISPEGGKFDVYQNTKWEPYYIDDQWRTQTRTYKTAWENWSFDRPWNYGWTPDKKDTSKMSRLKTDKFWDFSPSYDYTKKALTNF